MMAIDKGNNMSFTITIEPGQHQFDCAAGETVLDAALKNGVGLPYGCRNGACGACKGKVKSGRVDHGKAQDHALSADERAAGEALLCCAMPQSDLVIEAKVQRSQADIQVKTLPARVEALDRLAADVMLIKLRLPASERLQFLAGQYIDIMLDQDVRRSFSLANAPHADEFLELHVRHIPRGLFTDQVFSSMKVRDIVRINGPHGSFYLREDSQKPLILLAGGTGFAPIKAIVEHSLFESSRRPMTIYWGANTREGLYLHDLPLQWAAEHDHIRYVPVLMENWSGRSGLVHQAVLEDHPSLAGHQVYACGAPGMIEAAKRDFVVFSALPSDEFFSDAFTYAAAGPVLQAGS